MRRERILLAVVFWNSRRAKDDVGGYESSLTEFHQALNANKPEGFRFSATYRVAETPWFTPKNEIFEDWYVLKNFAALDSLDYAVMHTGSKDAHRHLMKSTAAASGAIFALTKGAARFDGLPEANWMLKPRNMTVDSLIASTRAQLPDGKCSLWTRALGLGPTQHCLLSSGPVVFPKNYRAFSAQRELIWGPSMARLQ